MNQNQDFQLPLCDLITGHYQPHRKTIAERTVPKLNKITLKNIKTSLRGTDCKAFTTDSWTSCNRDPCIALTAHFAELEDAVPKFMLYISFYWPYFRQHSWTFIEECFKKWAITGIA